MTRELRQQSSNIAIKQEMIHDKRKKTAVLERSNETGNDA